MVLYSKRLIAANFQVGHLSHCTFNTNRLFCLFMNVETYFKKKAPPFYRRGLTCFISSVCAAVGIAP